MKFKSSALCLAVIAASCSKKSDDSTTAPASGTSKLENPSSLIFAVNGALSSVPTSSLSLATKMSGNALCTEHGMPVKDGVTTAKGETSPDADRLSSSDADYASRFFMCLATLSAKDGASVETLQGSLSQVASIMCTFEKALGTITYTTAGTNLVANGSLEAKMDSECWPNGTPEGMTSVTLDSGTATLLDSSTGFEKELKFGSTSANVDYTLRFFNKNGVIGFRTIDSGVSPGVGGYSEIVLDSNKGTILVDVVDDRNGSGGADSAHRGANRMLVKGTIDTSTLKFTALTAMQGIRAESGNYASNPDAFSGVTMIGTEADGYYGTSVSYDGSAFTTNYAGCTGSKSTCPSSGLVYTDATFYSNRTVWEAHKTAKPICYDGSDLGFGSLATGSYGVCE